MSRKKKSEAPIVAPVAVEEAPEVETKDAEAVLEQAFATVVEELPEPEILPALKSSPEFQIAQLRLEVKHLRALVEDLTFRIDDHNVRSSHKI